MRIETWEQLKKYLNTLSDVEIKCCGRLSISKETTNQASVLIMEDGTLEIVENKIQWRPLTEEIIKERGFDFVDNSRIGREETDDEEMREYQERKNNQ